ncbi:MAG: hypothetical protein R2761_07475 [Acidimicrobiales bacterium]
MLTVGLLTACQGSDQADVGFGSGGSSATATTPGGSEGAPTSGGTGPTEAVTTASGPAASSSSTVDERALATAEEQIRAAVQKDWETWIECSTNPTSCDPAARLAEVRTTTGAYYTDNVAQLRQWAARGVVVRQPDGLPDNNFVITESVAVAPDGTTATAVTCTGDGRARYEPGPGGALALVAGSDAQGYYRSENYLVLDGATWKIDGFKILEESLLPEGGALCER